jgi:hypothetical protein
MARFKAQVNVGENLNVTYKISASVSDNDVNKPVKLTATDKVELCDDGDAIYGFINSVERATADGLGVVGVQIAGRRKVITSGTVVLGAPVEAAANPAIGVVLTTDWGIVSAKTAVSAQMATNASTTTLAAAVNAILDDMASGPLAKTWVVISAKTLFTTGLEVLIELQ